METTTPPGQGPLNPPTRRAFIQQDISTRNPGSVQLDCIYSSDTNAAVQSAKRQPRGPQSQGFQTAAHLHRRHHCNSQISRNGQNTNPSMSGAPQQEITSLQQLSSIDTDSCHHHPNSSKSKLMGPSTPLQRNPSLLYRPAQTRACQHPREPPTTSRVPQPSRPNDTSEHQSVRPSALHLAKGWPGLLLRGL